MWSEKIHIRVSKDMLERLDQIAEDIGLTRSQLIRVILRSFIKNYKEYLKEIMVGGVVE
jgi:metal-responsive CopG/Arc/MetJ family transcriptional regulator